MTQAKKLLSSYNCVNSEIGCLQVYAIFVIVSRLLCSCSIQTTILKEFVETNTSTGLAPPTGGLWLSLLIRDTWIICNHLNMLAAVYQSQWCLKCLAQLSSDLCCCVESVIFDVISVADRQNYFMGKYFLSVYIKVLHFSKLLFFY